MKSFLLFLTVLVSEICFSQVVLLEGKYTGKSICVQNPMTNPGFCIQKITVNGTEIQFENKAAIIIQLDSMNFKYGDPVKIELFHKTGCKPKILSENYDPELSFVLVSIKIGSAGILQWETKNENCKLPYFIEQYKWNRWVKVGSVEAAGNKDTNRYSFKTSSHSGDNKFRIKQLDSLGIPHLSRQAEFNSGIKKITYKGGYINTELTFSDVTMYEIYDQWGNIVISGTGKVVDCRKLPKGAYYINYDNSMNEFIKP